MSGPVTDTQWASDMASRLAELSKPPLAAPTD